MKGSSWLPRLITKLIEFAPSIIDAIRAKPKQPDGEELCPSRDEGYTTLPDRLNRPIYIPGLEDRDEERTNELMTRLTAEANARMRKERDES